MDPLGFALENFDAWAPGATGIAMPARAIDASGQLADGSACKGPADLRSALLAHPDQFVQTLTEKLMTYRAGPHACEYYDMPAVRAIVRDAARPGLPFRVHRAGHRAQRCRSA